MNLKTIIKNNIVKQGYKYIFVSVLSYLYVFVSLYLLVDVFGWDKQISFLLVYGVAYLMLYAIQLKFIFLGQHSKKKFIKYCVVIITFYLAANGIYYIGLQLNFNYLISTLLTICVLMPLRFIVYKYVVYKQ
ncbi:GtrA family protein [Mesoflavibacter profundi]|uniref:GtrA family protein n=1 Tax=Mesoflavibacter profundi TaxID=2708110 RepID=UPI003A4C7CE3